MPLLKRQCNKAIDLNIQSAYCSIHNRHTFMNIVLALANDLVLPWISHYEIIITKIQSKFSHHAVNHLVYQFTTVNTLNNRSNAYNVRNCRIKACCPYIVMLPTLPDQLNMPRTMISNNYEAHLCSNISLFRSYISTCNGWKYFGKR